MQCEIPGKQEVDPKILTSDVFRDVARDLLPLPLLEEFVVDDRLLSRAVKRRLLKRQKLVHITNETVKALEKLYGAERAPTRRLSDAQRQGQQCLIQERQKMGAPPADANGKAALGEQLAKPPPCQATPRSA